MKQVLTQQEIDALLNAVSSGEIDAKEMEPEKEQPTAKLYDFRRPTKLSKEYTNTLFMIFEDYSKIAASLLSTQLRTNVSMQLVSLEQISYDEFIHSIPKFTLLGLFHSTPLNGIQMIELNPQLCSFMVELLCGGSENQAYFEEKSTKKSFTDIEMAILEEVVKIFVTSFSTSWKEINELESDLDSLDTNPQLLQNMSPNEPVILITFTLKIFKYSTFVNLCVPYVFFEGIIDKLSFRNWFDSSKKNSQDDVREKTQLKKNLFTVELNLKTVLGSTTMPLSDFLQLEAGDIVRLDQKISDPLKSYIEGRPFFYVKPGKKKNILAIELLENMKGDLEE